MATSTERSPHMADHNEYVTVQSALQSFEDRFEAHMRSQSRLLEGIHVRLQHHEKHLRRQQERIRELEDAAKLMQSKLDVLTSQLRKAEQSIAAVSIEIPRGSKRRQIGKFSISERLERTSDQDIGLGLFGEEVSGNGTQSSVQGAASISTLGSSSACKSDEEAWEEYLGFGSQRTDLRPQHSYRKPQAMSQANGRSHEATDNEHSTLERQVEGIQPVSYKRSVSKHGIGTDDTSGTLKESRVSMTELLDRLSEELMGFEQERRAGDDSA